MAGLGVGASRRAVRNCHSLVHSREDGDVLWATVPSREKSSDYSIERSCWTTMPHLSSVHRKKHQLLPAPRRPASVVTCPEGSRCRHRQLDREYEYNLFLPA